MPRRRPKKQPIRAQIVHEIYEAGTAKRGYPVVVHLFNGATKAEARRYFRAHMKTDSFLRGCTKRGKWSQVRCKVRMRMLSQKEALYCDHCGKRIQVGLIVGGPDGATMRVGPSCAKQFSRASNLDRARFLYGNRWQQHIDPRTLRDEY
jgi:hypothetical protein